ncbi:anti-sigma factor [Beijerinckia sp. L45]|uniref:anti-sigma factor family protein n=1 Tax=Beijerinckia sp. L45 TaxID=1641855 RepID=UPI00131A9BE4|nr:anti-sigma factor [Beijerinckia sp. L45]
MSDEHCDDMLLLVQADVDGELSPAEAARVAAHLDRCAACSAAQADMLALSARLRDVPRYPASEALKTAVRARIASRAPVQRVQRSTPFGRVPAFASGLAVAACLMLVVGLPRGDDPADAIVAAHIRALLPGHLTDVASTDQHTVKPWFDGRLPFAPPVKDLKTVGFPLIGGRLDYFAGHMAAALVYRHAAHEINLFVWPDAADAAPSHGSINGYNYERWAQDGMSFWLVSDLNAADLADFSQRWKSL